LVGILSSLWADARKKRDEAKRLIADGKAPSIEKQLHQIDAETKARITFKEVAEEYYDNLVDRGLAAATLRKKLGTLRTSPNQFINAL
jgi:hypothetical protein